MRYAYHALLLSLSVFLFVNHGHTQAPDKYALADEASQAWGACNRLSVEKLHRAFGNTTTPEQIADMAFAECYELEMTVKRRFIDASGDEDAVLIALANSRRGFHDTLVHYVRQLGD